ncbi:MAG: hypothetical protein JKY75_07165 [Erythrobacter sp.]|jgi:hypothetical protein|nr:hypothetical protein [Erythrobacter sp.]MBL4896635.1 hypothetical protein [Erythrobacter sp.]
MEMNDSGGNWHSITDALDVIGISRGTLYDRIRKGELKSKKEGKNRFVWIDTSTEIFNNTYGNSYKNTNGSQSNIVKELRDQVSYWKNQVEQKEEIIEQKDKDLREQSMRHDATIFRILEQNQNLLEVKRATPFWQFWK